jgi:hypothetical protein
LRESSISSSSSSGSVLKTSVRCEANMSAFSLSERVHYPLGFRIGGTCACGLFSFCVAFHSV